MHNPERYGEPLCVCLHLDSDMSAAFLRFPRVFCLGILAALDINMILHFRMRKWFQNFGFGSGRDYR